MTTEPAFDRAWITLAQAGHCDERGGAEYRRVKREWIIARRPRAVVAFILRAANKQAPAKKAENVNGERGSEK